MWNAADFELRVAAEARRLELPPRNHGSPSERAEFELLVELLRQLPFIKDSLDRLITLELLATTLERYLAAAKVGASGGAQNGGGTYPPRIIAACELMEQTRREVATHTRARDNWRKAGEKGLRVAKARQQLGKLGRLVPKPGTTAIKRDFWLEIFDPHHRPPESITFLKMAQRAWKEKVDPQSPEYDPEYRESLWDYLAANPQPGDADQATYRYLKSEAERAAYEVEVHGKTLVRKASRTAFDTTAMNVNDEGMVEGFAIWVISPKGQIYSGRQMDNEETVSGVRTRFDLHHSAFLAGSPVLAAGTWCVKQGRLEVITGSSGHYQPEFAHFVNGLRLLDKREIDLASVAAEWMVRRGQRYYFNAKQLAMPGVKATWEEWPTFVGRALQPVLQANALAPAAMPAWVTRTQFDPPKAS